MIIDILIKNFQFLIKITEMSNYKKTLNLPYTDFPMKANLSFKELDFLKDWEKENLYQLIRQSRRKEKKYILHDGPPYANGDIHIGHAINKILKDIIIKYKILDGYDAPYIPGWDCHGLPIELQVEKKYGKSKNKFMDNIFRKKCRIYAQSQVDKQMKSFKRLGILADWKNAYLTMSYQYESKVLYILASIFEKGYIKKGFKPVHWCTKCESALAEAEVEYQEKNSDSIYVKFYIKSIKKISQIFKKNIEIASAIVWTTTPWTLSANLAVAINADINYVLIDIQKKSEKFIIAENLVKSFIQLTKCSSFLILAKCKGYLLENILLKHPFNSYNVPIILGKNIKCDIGTGLVHIAPAHGVEDYKISLEKKIKFQNIVQYNGVFLSDVFLVGGKYYSDANSIIVNFLKKHKKLWYYEKYKHSYPYCWRHNIPLIFLSTPQWFIIMNDKFLTNIAIKEIEKISWIPKWGFNRIKKMIENRPDWCISRQRKWGTPLPLFIHKKTGNLHPNTVQLIRKIASKVAKGGIEAWFESKISDFLEKNDQKKYDIIYDTLDIWLDSGISFHSVLIEKKLPLADLYLEGSDQYRGWFHSSLLSAIATIGTAPYKSVLTHGFIIDENGKKMSKSLGNIVSVEKLVQKYGADILRLWTASIDYRSDIIFSESMIKSTIDIYRKIRNTIRFLLANLKDFCPESDLINTEDMVLIDQWAIEKTLSFQKEIRKLYDSYLFHLVVKKIYEFCSLDMGGFYLDIIKDRQYTCKKFSKIRRSCQSVLYHILEAMVRWITPILSFTANEIWKKIPGKRSVQWVFLDKWYKNLSKIPINSHIQMYEWDFFITLRNIVNQAIENKRKKNEIGSSLDIHVILYLKKEKRILLKKLGKELKFLLITSDVKIKKYNSFVGEKTALEDIKIDIFISNYKKCKRCWHRVKNIGSNIDYYDICGRCVENLFQDGEKRFYV